ncbi:hypothetical protein [Amycolatopsis nigrescens]|uniref:hypothetical protein n=1 Tax=Amycolatopsis nigrescens TaxID=381445 RepID=UPI00036D40ED|nr:hypothetical protein [Amycolatopsis nigrescens]
MADRRALILSGTGMLSAVAEALTQQGWHVVLPSRRYCPIPDEQPRPGAAAVASMRPPGYRPAEQAESVVRTGRALWVEADWSAPEQLAERAGRALGGPADLLVAWVHRSHRRGVLRAVRPLLAERAPVVEVWNDDRLHSLDELPEPVLPEHPAQQVLLGRRWQADRTRWLTGAEIAEGVLGAVGRAVGAHPSSAHQIGLLRPWPVAH